jgi:hypothetical protein
MKVNTILFAISPILILQMLLMGCSRTEVKPPEINVDKENVNQQILLRAPKNFNTFKTTDDINLELKYNTQYEIVFPNDYNLKMFLQTDDHWVEIHEIPTIRLPEGNIVLSPNALMPAVENIFVSPDLPDYNLKYYLRVYVIGTMNINDEDIKVAAYADVTLHP